MKMEKHGMFLKLVSFSKNLVTQLVSTFWNSNGDIQSLNPPPIINVSKRKKKKSVSFIVLVHNLCLVKKILVT